MLMIVSNFGRVFALALVLISHEYGDRLFHGMLTLTPLSIAT